MPENKDFPATGKKPADVPIRRRKFPDPMFSLVPRPKLGYYYRLI